MIGVERTNNFLDKDFFQKLQILITSTKYDFAWYQIKTMVVNTTNNLGYFTHSFYNNNTINSNYYSEYITPILNKLNAKAVIEVRSNLFPSVFFKKSDFHIDNNFNCKTAILYLNTCDGGTEFKINDKIEFIKSEENKIVIFNSNIEHRAVTSKNADFRYIINFNYFD